MENEELKHIIQSLISEIDNLLEQIQRKHIQSANDIGNIRDNLNKLSPFFDTNLDSNNETEYLPLFLTAKDYLISYRDKVQSHAQKTGNVFKETQYIAASGAVFAALSGTAWSVIDSNNYPENEISFPQDQYSRDDYYNMFIKIDESLGKTYQEIDQILYNTESDPERAALFMARQSFDHFFDVIAKNDDVRQSPYWSKKEPHVINDQNIVWRIEKIRYAAHTRIKDPLKAQNLIDQSNYIIETYKLLNKAHTRGRINKEEAKNLIISIKKILEEWIVALDS